jgi:hypothetical protein
MNIGQDFPFELLYSLEIFPVISPHIHHELRLKDFCVLNIFTIAPSPLNKLFLLLFHKFAFS